MIQIIICDHRGIYHYFSEENHRLQMSLESGPIKVYVAGTGSNIDKLIAAFSAPWTLEIK